MATIEIDFDVFKALTLRRETESTSYNDVLRDLLGLDSISPKAAPSSPAPAKGALMLQGIAFPEGTQFRVTYKGRTYHAEVRRGQWVGEDGIVRRTPSDAATAITRTNVNGWRFWDFRRPGDSAWRKMRVLQDA